MVSQGEGQEETIFSGIKEQETRGGEGERTSEWETAAGEGGGGVFKAIGGTIVEIGQTTKDLIAGGGEYPEAEAGGGRVMKQRKDEIKKE